VTRFHRLLSMGLALVLLCSGAWAADASPARATTALPSNLPPQVLHAAVHGADSRGHDHRAAAGGPAGTVGPGRTGAGAAGQPSGDMMGVRPVVFGSQIFSGRFANLGYTGFNPEYQIATGDRIALRMWGALNYDAVQVVDAQGNIFVPNAGPIQVRGVRNDQLNQRVDEQIKRTYRANVGVYASLESAQPVKVYVTGYVRAPVCMRLFLGFGAELPGPGRWHRR
jgi:hypothetical protein